MDQEHKGMDAAERAADAGGVHSGGVCIQDACHPVSRKRIHQYPGICGTGRISAGAAPRAGEAGREESVQ